MCESINFCSNIDDYRPIQSTLLTRFTTTDSSELWRTTNQDYGAFYYRQLPQYCIPDILKAKIHRRHNRFQDWLSYQRKCQNSCSPLIANSTNNNQTIIPSNRNETVRITHRKKFLSPCDDECNPNNFSPCGEDGLITEFIVKKILKKLQCFITPNEYHDVAECAQLLVTKVLTEEPSLCTNEIIDRVVTIMITPPNNICYEPISCPSPQPINDNCQSNELPACISENQPTCLSNVFDKLTNLEDAISKLCNQL